MCDRSIQLAQTALRAFILAIWHLVPSRTVSVELSECSAICNRSRKAPPPGPHLLADRLSARPTTYRDPPRAYPWPEARLVALEEVLESGDLSWVQRMLDSKRTAMILESEDCAAISRIQAVRDGLARARILETEKGGEGSLIHPDHPMTLSAREPNGSDGTITR